MPQSQPPLPPRPSDKNMQHLNMKNEADRLKTFEKWTVPFMDKNHMVFAGFYFTNRSDVVRCAFCGVQVGCWEEGDDDFIEHRRWSPSCEYIRGLFAGGIPICSENQPGASSPRETARSNDVCGPYMEMKPYSRPERSKYNSLYFHVCDLQRFMKHRL
jgi:hypothetical protein